MALLGCHDVLCLKNYESMRVFINLQVEIFYWIFSIERAYIGKISHLRELNLSGNAIDNLAPKLFQDLKNLIILDLSSNKLDQNLSPAAFSTLPTSIKHLDISSKNFTFFKGFMFWPGVLIRFLLISVSQPFWIPEKKVWRTPKKSKRTPYWWQKYCFYEV